MAGNTEQIIMTLFGKGKLEEVPIEQLRELVETYPSFNIGHYLLSKKLDKENNEESVTANLKTALHFNNPFWLQWLLQNTDHEPLARVNETAIFPFENRESYSFDYPGKRQSGSGETLRMLPKTDLDFAVPVPDSDILIRENFGTEEISGEPHLPEERWQVDNPMQEGSTTIRESPSTKEISGEPDPPDEQCQRDNYVQEGNIPIQENQGTAEISGEPHLQEKRWLVDNSAQESGIQLQENQEASDIPLETGFSERLWQEDIPAPAADNNSLMKEIREKPDISGDEDLSEKEWQEAALQLRILEQRAAALRQSARTSAVEDYPEEWKEEKTNPISILQEETTTFYDPGTTLADIGLPEQPPISSIEEQFEESKVELFNPIPVIHEEDPNPISILNQEGSTEYFLDPAVEEDGPPEALDIPGPGTAENGNPEYKAISPIEAHLEEQQVEIINPISVLHQEASTSKFEIPGAVDEEVGFSESLPIPPFKDLPGGQELEVDKSTKEEIPIFDPYYTIDYFASQGIKFVYQENPNDKFGKQLKSFTDWLKIMKRLPQKQLEAAIEQTMDSSNIERFAAHSLEEKDTLTETMAAVLVKQGKNEKAIEIYQKLSLLIPSKSAYFADRIEELKT